MTERKIWKCTVCAHEHRGAGAPDACPVCGVGPDKFEPVASEADDPIATGKSWLCTVCGYVHDGPLAPETCPICGAAARFFKPLVKAVARVGRHGGPHRVVVLGDGVAGLEAAEHARRHSADVSITLVGQDEGLPYYRLNLTRFLAGEVSEADLPLRSEGWFEEKGIERVVGQVVHLDREARTVSLEDGGAIPYDTLVLATGAEPSVPPIPGVSLGGVTVLRTLEHARSILDRVRPGGKAVVIGGGLLGLECAGALARHGMEVTVTEVAPWLLPRQLPEAALHILREHLLGVGVHVHCGCQVSRILGDGDVVAVDVGDRRIPADLVVLAAGVRPRTALAEEAGLAVGRGVLVDRHLTTSDPDILAAGDVAEFDGELPGLWQVAWLQGAVAGTRAAGGNHHYDGLPTSTRLKVLDLDIISVGQVDPAKDGCRVLQSTGDGSLVHLVCRGGRLVGASLIGATDRADVVVAAVEGGEPVVANRELVGLFPGLAGLCGA